MSRHKHCYRLHLNTLNDGNGADWVIGSVARRRGIGAWATIWLTIFITETISSDGQPIPFLSSTCPLPTLIGRFTIGRALMDAHSHSHRSGKLDLRFPIDLWSIYEAIDRDNLSRPIVLWQSKEDEMEDEMDRSLQPPSPVSRVSPRFGGFPSSRARLKMVFLRMRNDENNGYKRRRRGTSFA